MDWCVDERKWGRERGKLMEKERERVVIFIFFSNYEREFHKIHINRGKERIV